MRRPVVLIVSVAAAAFLIAGAGASAHTIQLLTRAAGTHSSLLSDEATGARTESPEPAESPEATPKAEPTEKPKPAETPEAAETEAADDTDSDTETGDSGEGNQHDHQGGGGDHESGGGD